MMKTAFALLLFLTSSPLFADQSLCAEAQITLEMNACLSEMLKDTEQHMRVTLSEAMQRHQDDGQAMEAISDSQHNWQSYRDSHCRSLYEIWRQGSIRSAIYLGCAIQLTEARIEQLRNDYLTLMDSAETPKPDQKPGRSSGGRPL